MTAKGNNEIMSSIQSTNTYYEVLLTTIIEVDVFIFTSYFLFGNFYYDFKFHFIYFFLVFYCFRKKSYKNTLKSLIATHFRLK